MESNRTSNERRLAALLRLAYSGELAAAHAYHGHARSVSDPHERARIREIEEEELHHRRQVGEMLRALDVTPRRFLEVKATIVGRTLSALCHVAGWLAPMVGAGRLESRNIREYEAAARYAWACERREWVDALLTMAEVEWEHEKYFRERVSTHWLAKRLPLWPRPAPREEIRRAFMVETGFTVETGAGLEPDSSETPQLAHADDDSETLEEDLMARTVSPLLMFYGDAEEAMTLYVSLFADSEVRNVVRYGSDEQGAEGSVQRADFTLSGQDVICIDSPVRHEFGFTPALSLFVECADAAELQKAFEELSRDGEVLMPLDDYGFSAQFGWLSDRFGVSWQLNLE